MKKTILTAGLALATMMIGCGDKSKSNDAAPAAEVLNFNIETGAAELKVWGALSKTVNFSTKSKQEDVNCAVDEKTNSFSFWATRKENRRDVEFIRVDVPRPGTKLDGSTPVKITSTKADGQGKAYIELAPEKGSWMAKDCFAAINLINERAHFILDCKDVAGRNGKTTQNISLRFQMACDAKKLKR